MPTYKNPGVYVEEPPGRSGHIEGVGTSTAAFVGYVERGPLNEPTSVGSLQEYQRRFGSLRGTEEPVPGRNDRIMDPMGLGLRSFFQNGGTRAYVVRIASGEPAAAHGRLLVDGDQVQIGFAATSPGTWGNSLAVRIFRIPGDSSPYHFRLSVGWRTDDSFDETERFDISIQQTDVQVPFIEDAINGVSELVTVYLRGAAPSAGGELAVRTEEAPLKILMRGGTNGGAPGLTQYGSAFDLLGEVDDINIVLVPDQPWGTRTQRAIVELTVAHCEAKQNRMVIFDLDPGTHIEARADIANLALPTSKFAAVYYPWVRVSNPLHDPERNPNAAPNVLAAPGAFAAGVWARTDAKRGVWKAPAGTEAKLIGIVGLVDDVGDTTQDSLNSPGVNAIRTLPGHGPVICGARTRATNADFDYRYVPVRRLATFIEESVVKGIAWSVFQRNDEQLWSSLRVSVSSFMERLFCSGALQGTQVTEAYFVKCGLGSTMSQTDIDLGMVVLEIAFAPLKPAEFVLLRFQQKVLNP